MERKGRITVILDTELEDKVIALAKEQKRSKSTMAAILIEESPQLKESPISACDHDFQPLSLTNADGSISRCIKCGQRI